MTDPYQLYVLIIKIIINTYGKSDGIGVSLIESIVHQLIVQRYKMIW